MRIFFESGKITEADSKTNIFRRFSVAENTKKLTVDFSYFPKTVEKELANAQIDNAIRKYGITFANHEAFLPVNNLVTLSFDENGDYRGACHRQNNIQKIIISDKNSTPGIFNRAVTAGEWQVVMNVHYAGCPIEYSIKIEAE